MTFKTSLISTWEGRKDRFDSFFKLCKKKEVAQQAQSLLKHFSITKYVDKKKKKRESYNFQVEQKSLCGLWSFLVLKKFHFLTESIFLTFES